MAIIESLSVGLAHWCERLHRLPEELVRRPRLRCRFRGGTVIGPFDARLLGCSEHVCRATTVVFFAFVPLRCLLNLHPRDELLPAFYASTALLSAR